MIELVMAGAETHKQHRLALAVLPVHTQTIGCAIARRTGDESTAEPRRSPSVVTPPFQTGTPTRTRTPTAMAWATRRTDPGRDGSPRRGSLTPCLLTPAASLFDYRRRRTPPAEEPAATRPSWKPSGSQCVCGDKVMVWSVPGCAWRPRRIERERGTTSFLEVVPQVVCWPKQARRRSCLRRPRCRVGLTEVGLEDVALESRRRAFLGWCAVSATQRQTVATSEDVGTLQPRA